MYNITNVNKDLTIPAVQFNNAYTFEDHSASTQVVHRPFNNFLQQATNIDTNGNPFRVAADLTPGTFSITETESGMLLEFEVCNVGSTVFVTDTMRTCVYVGSNQGPRAVYINSFKVDGSPFFIMADSCYFTQIMIPFYFFCPYLPFDSLCFSLNDYGLGSGQGGLPPECNYENDTITLSAHLEPIIEEFYDTVCVGQTYDQHDFYIEGDQISSAGDYVDSLYYLDDCRYISVLFLHVVEPGSYDSTVTVCDVFTWQGRSYTVSQDLTFSESVGEFCDRVVTIHLTVNHSDTSNYEEQTVCDSLVWHNHVYRESGRYYFSGQTLEGCLYYATLNLTVGHGSYEERSEVVCDSYVWHGEVLTESGDYEHGNGGQGDCDSIEVLHLTVYPSFFANDEVDLCQGGSVTVHGTTVTAPSVYRYDFHTIHQCDSIYETEVILRPVYRRVDTVSMCAGDPSVGYRWVDGETYYHSTNEPECRLTTRYGCDSILRLNLSIDRSLRAVIHCEPEFPTYENNHVCLSNATSNSLMHRWYLFDGTVSEDDYCCFDIPFDYDSVMVRLVVSSLSGCYDTATLIIPMDRSAIYIPNAFTPNLATNKVFKVYGTGLLEAEAMVYTREGLLVSTFDALREGWDGTQEGERMPQGTYVYRVRYRTVWRPNEWQSVFGTVTLLR